MTGIPSLSHCAGLAENVERLTGFCYGTGLHVTYRASSRVSSNAPLDRREESRLMHFHVFPMLQMEAGEML